VSKERKESKGKIQRASTSRESKARSNSRKEEKKVEVK
jgi:hypothetical protein